MAPAPVAGGWMTNCPVRPTPPWKFPSSGYWAEVTELGGGGPLAALAVPPLAAAAASTATSAAVAPLPLVLIRIADSLYCQLPDAVNGARNRHDQQRFVLIRDWLPLHHFVPPVCAPRVSTSPAFKVRTQLFGCAWVLGHNGRWYRCVTRFESLPWP